MLGAIEADGALKSGDALELFDRIVQHPPPCIEEWNLQPDGQAIVDPVFERQIRARELKIEEEEVISSPIAGQDVRFENIHMQIPGITRDW